MAEFAAAAGVSRQTLYKEFGNRNEFGLAFVISVGESFLDEVEEAVLAHVDDPRAAIGAALELFLRTAGEDPLIESGTHDAVAARLKHGEHFTIAGAKHEVMMETDELRALFWEAFDRLAKGVPGQ